MPKRQKVCLQNLFNWFIFHQKTSLNLLKSTCTQMFTVVVFVPSVTLTLYMNLFSWDSTERWKEVVRGDQMLTDDGELTCGAVWTEVWNRLLKPHRHLSTTAGLQPGRAGREQVPTVRGQEIKYKAIQAIPIEDMGRYLSVKMTNRPLESKICLISNTKWSYEVLTLR